MKKLLFFLSLLLTVSCTEKGAESDHTNGFGPYDGQSVYLGDQETVEAFKALDKAWKLTLKILTRSMAEPSV